MLPLLLLPLWGRTPATVLPAPAWGHPTGFPTGILLTGCSSSPAAPLWVPFHRCSSALAPEHLLLPFPSTRPAVCRVVGTISVPWLQVLLRRAFFCSPLFAPTGATPVAQPLAKPCQANPAQRALGMLTWKGRKQHRSHNNTYSFRVPFFSIIYSPVAPSLRCCVCIIWKPVLLNPTSFPPSISSESLSFICDISRQ